MILIHDAVPGKGHLAEGAPTPTDNLGRPEPDRPAPFATAPADDDLWDVDAWMIDMVGLSSGWRTASACFQTLGLEPDADPRAIKARYRELAKRHHPDAGGDAESFASLEAAYREALEMTGGPR